jgi:hypothetical protein
MSVTIPLILHIHLLLGQVSCVSYHSISTLYWPYRPESFHSLSPLLVLHL